MAKKTARADALGRKLRMGEVGREDGAKEENRRGGRIGIEKDAGIGEEEGEWKERKGSRGKGRGEKWGSYRIESVGGWVVFFF